ncbi:hypothetical protein KKF81_02230, partial [Candidatus Micrarchaeota archaeon]|nr:hypothetical protein [Candidatus Micrarchaeota archaeon]
MKNILLLAFLFLLLGMGCLASPSREHLCPDGTIVSEESKCPDYNSEIIDVNPQEFKTVFIKNNQNSYVMAGGEVQTEIIINKGESVWMLGDYISTDNSERYHRVNVINKKGNVYLINFSAPLIPGEFYFGATKRKDGGPEELIFVYNLTVIGEVSNETMAYSIAEMFMIANTPDQFNCPFICIAPSYPNIISFSPYRHTQNWNVT